MWLGLMYPGHDRDCQPSMERYQVILAYDGSHFKGFQRQVKDRSVQGVVEAALRTLGWQGASLLAAGRTDAGTHATGQVVAFDLEWTHSPQDLQQALNYHLPTDVVASAVRRVKPSFHPRYDADWRRYEYQIFCQHVRHPLMDPYAWRVWPAADLVTLDNAASLVLGTHDFSAFGTPPHSGGNPIRSVLASSWRQEAPHMVYEIKANAFLYHMVRRLVFVQVNIAQGNLDISDLVNALEPASSDLSDKVSGKRLVHGLAPARGLTLVEVHYPLQAVSLDQDNNEIEKSVDRQLDPTR